MNPVFKEMEAVTALVEKYFNALYRADIDTLKTIFHEKASMNGYLGEHLLIGTPDPLYQDLSSKPSMAENKNDTRYVIKHLQVTGNTADVTFMVDGFFGTACIEDHFHLIKDNGEWKIICKTFTTV